ncbi:MAG: hypothetical protein ACO3EK_05100, partial [Alphaproteobacteria bacterium]
MSIIAARVTRAPSAIAPRPLVAPGTTPGNRTRRSQATASQLYQPKGSALDGVRHDLRRLEIVTPAAATNALAAMMAGKKALYRVPSAADAKKL